MNIYNSISFPPNFHTYWAGDGNNIYDCGGGNLWKTKVVHTIQFLDETVVSGVIK